MTEVRQHAVEVTYSKNDASGAPLLTEPPPVPKPWEQSRRLGRRRQAAKSKPPEKAVLI